MSIRNGIYDLLKALEADVYPIVAPQETSDTYITFSVRREAVRTQDGVTINNVLLTLNIYAAELDDCVTMAATMYAGLEAKSGTYDSETLHITNWVSEDGGYIPDLDKFAIIQEYELMFL